MIFGLILTLATALAHAKSDVSCQTKHGEMSQTTTCFYKDSTLEQAYNVAMKAKEIPNLKSSLPTKNLYYKPIDTEKTGIIGIHYRWLNKKKLQVYIHYEGGETVWTLTEQPKGTQIVYDYSAD